MYCVANRNNVKKAIASCELPLAQGKSERKLLRLIDKGPKWDSSHGSHAIAAFLRKLDSFFDWSYGVEGIFEFKDGGSVDCTNYDEDEIIDVQYLNAGDTYATTLLWEKGKLRIGCWGDCFEFSG